MLDTLQPKCDSFLEVALAFVSVAVLDVTVCGLAVFRLEKCMMFKWLADARLAWLDMVTETCWASWLVSISSFLAA